jgi:hypothetical protein
VAPLDGLVWPGQAETREIRGSTIGTQYAVHAHMPPLMFPLVLAALGAVLDIPRPQVVRAEPAEVAVSLGDVAQRAARIALRTAGVPGDDADVDALASRARASALLPEVSVRLIESAAGATDYVSDTGTLSTASYGPGLSVMGSMTFHLEKLAYSGQEARLQRLRVERLEMRTRITQRVIDEVGKWARAIAEEHDEPETSPAHLDATIRRANAQMALDVWTGGWFSTFVAGKHL